MKRIFIIIFILILLIGISILIATNLSKSNTDIKTLSNDNNNLIEESKEELYRNLFITLLYPHVEKAIHDYYSKYMTYLPGEDPYSYNFLSIDRIPEKNYSFIIKLKVTPYVGPHLSVGVDHITFKLNLNNVTLQKFEHIKNYNLPPNYQNILKETWPPS